MFFSTIPFSIRKYIYVGEQKKWQRRKFFKNPIILLYLQRVAYKHTAPSREENFSLVLHE